MYEVRSGHSHRARRLRTSNLIGMFPSNAPRGPLLRSVLWRAAAVYPGCARMTRKAVNAKH
jgi:hypothetical protein